MKSILSLLFLLTFGALWAQQTIVIHFDSDILQEKRTLRIHLPKSFEKTTETYPLILTFDGEYLFYNMLGNSELLLATNHIPETIIVGIDQNYPDKKNPKYFARWYDCSYDPKTVTIKNKGINFKKFIEKELIPFLEKTYRINNFKLLAGHSYTASYANFFLLESSDFQSFILISPFLSPEMSSRVADRLTKNNNHLSYYLSTSDKDLSGHIQPMTKLDSLINERDLTQKTQYLFDHFKSETHYSLISRSIPKALKGVFKYYGTIQEEELVSEKDLLLYLQNRYRKIKEKYDLEIPIRTDDLDAIYWEAEDREDWTQLEKIGNFSTQLYPDYADGYFMLSEVAKQKKNYPKALELYKKGYAKLGDDVLNKKDFYKNIEVLKKMIEQNK